MAIEIMAYAAWRSQGESNPCFSLERADLTARFRPRASVNIQ
jgi:hypothetical protein